MTVGYHTVSPGGSTEFEAGMQRDGQGLRYHARYGGPRGVRVLGGIEIGQEWLALGGTGIQHQRGR